MIRLVLLVLAVAAAHGLDCAVSPAIGHIKTVRAVVPLDDGTVLTCDGTVRLWDTAAQRLRWTHTGEPLRASAHETICPPPVLRAAGDRVVAAWGHGVVVLDRRNGRELSRHVTADHEWLGCSPDGRWLFVGGHGYIGWQPVDGGAGGNLRLDAVGGWFTWAVFSGDGRRVWLGARYDRQGPVVELERTADGWRKSGYQATRCTPAAAAASLEGGCVATLGDGTEVLALAFDAGLVQAWRLPLGGETQPLCEIPLEVGVSQFRVVMQPAGPGKVLQGQRSDAYAKHVLVDLERKTAAAALTGCERVSALAWDGKAWLVADDLEHEVLRVAQDGQAVLARLGRQGLAEGGAAQSGMARDASGRWLCVGTRQGVQRWDLALLRLESTFATDLAPTIEDLGGGIAAYSFRRDGDAWNAPWHYRCLDPAGPGWLDRAESRSRPVVLDGRLYLPTEDAVRVLDLATHAELAALPLPAVGNILRHDTVAAAPDGRTLAIVRGGSREFQVNVSTETTPRRWEAHLIEVGTWRRLGGEAMVDDAGWQGDETGLVVRDGGWSLGGKGRLLGADGRWAAAGTALPPEVRRPAPAPAAATSWYAQIAISVGHLGELVLRRPDGPPVHLLADRGSWAAWNDEGVFDGDRSAARLLVASIEGRPTALDEIAPWSNRPDRLLADLGCNDSELLAAAAAPADRRRRDLPAQRPEVMIRSSAMDGAVVRLQVEARAAAGLAAIEAWINGVPLPTTAASGASATVEVRIPLGPGANTIEVAAVDSAGTRSWRVQQPAATRPADGGMVAACLGVSRYRDPALALRYAAKDAIDLGLALCDQPGSARVLVQTDREVGTESLAALGELYRSTRPADVAVLYLAGHGLYLRTPAPVYHYLPWGADPQDLAATAIPWSRIVALFADCPARRRLIILDTCESGNLEDEPPAGAAGLLVAGARGLRGLSAVTTGTGLARAFRASDRSRFVTADLDRSAGVVVLASARGGEPSFESEPDANGLFTQCLLDILRGGAKDDPSELAADELVRRLAEAVGSRSGGRQRPTIDRDNALAGIRLSRLPALE